MNRNIIIYMLGWIMNTEAIFMALSVVTVIVYRESTGFIYLGIMAVCDLLGPIYTRKKPYTKISFIREGFATVSPGWTVSSFFGCIPSVISGKIPYIIDAMFEIVPDFITMGLSIISKVEDIPHATLTQRGFSYWIGGMEILVFILAILPMTGNYNMHVMRIENPGPSVEKLVSKIRITAKPLYFIYFCMVTVMMILLLLEKIPSFDSICMSFGTTDTGDFACRNSGQADCTVHQQTIIITLMLLFGVNFNVYYLLLIRRPKNAGRYEELRGHLAVVAIAIPFIIINIRSLLPSLLMASHQATSQISSIITTTGYSAIGYNSWPEFSETILLLIMLIGTCVDNTGGGMKVSRVMIVFKEIKKEMASVVHPCSVKVLKSEGEPLEYNIPRSLSAYIITYFMVFGISTSIVSLDSYDFIISFSTVAVNLNNVGPGMSVVGPVSNYSMTSYLSKTVLILDMLAGRLGLFSMLVLLPPGAWKRN